MVKDFVESVFGGIGGFSFVFFSLEILITVLIVGAVVSWKEKRNWRRFRQNYAQNLFEKTKMLGREYNDGKILFAPFRSEVDLKNSTGPDRTHYELDIGTALRGFEAKLRGRHIEIKQFIELGFIGISADLSETISNYQAVLDKLADTISILVRSDVRSGLPRPEAAELKRFKELTDSLYEPLVVRNEISGIQETVSSPFCKLRLHLINFGFRVDYAHSSEIWWRPRRRVRILREFVSTPGNKIKDVPVQTGIFLSEARLRGKDISRDEFLINSFDEFTRDCIGTDRNLKLIIDNMICP